MSQEEVVGLLERVAGDEELRSRLLTADSAESLELVAKSVGFSLQTHSVPDALTDADLDGVASAATDRTCYGTTDCCQTKRTCFGTTDCCH